MMRKFCSLDKCCEGIILVVTSFFFLRRNVNVSHHIASSLCCYYTVPPAPYFLVRRSSFATCAVFWDPLLVRLHFELLIFTKFEIICCGFL